MKKLFILTLICFVPVIIKIRAQDRSASLKSEIMNMPVNRYERRIHVYKKKTFTTAIILSALNTAIPVGLGTLMIHSSEDNVGLYSGEGWGGVIGGFLLVSYGVVIGPSIGNFYADDLANGLGGIAIRTFGGIVAMEAQDGSLRSRNRQKLGYCLIIGGAIYNFISCQASVKRYNRFHAGNVNISFYPVTQLASKTYGIGLQLQFN